MNLVLDASVVVKWFFPDKEPHLDKALLILNKIRDGSINLLQPEHWLAEVTAVLVRIQPQITNSAINLLYAMNIPIKNDLKIYYAACALADKLNHHLFDTLYHAIALASSKTKFVTADEKYYKKAAQFGNIIHLADF